VLEAIVSNALRCTHCTPATSNSVIANLQYSPGQVGATAQLNACTFVTYSTHILVVHNAFIIKSV